MKPQKANVGEKEQREAERDGLALRGVEYYENERKGEDRRGKARGGEVTLGETVS